MSDFKEINNPSDKAFIDVTDKEASCLAVCLISKGAYGIDDFMPIFLFGGHDEWFINEFGHDFEQSLKKTGNKRIADALNTVKLGYEERTSMNDIVGCAENLAKSLQDKKNGND